MTDQAMIKDLIDLQAELPVIPFDSENPHFKSKFASLAQITQTVQPLLAAHGFAWVTTPCTVDGQPMLHYQLIHASGEKIDEFMPLQLSALTPQALGSAITYARRYALCAVLGIVSEADDDGNTATNTRKVEGTVQTPQPSAADRAREFAERVQPKEGYQEGDSCPKCERLSADMNIRVGKFIVAKGGVNRGQLQCTGKGESGEWLNHPAPVSESDKDKVKELVAAGDIDPDDVPF